MSKPYDRFYSAVKFLNVRGFFDLSVEDAQRLFEEYLGELKYWKMDVAGYVHELVEAHTSRMLEANTLREAHAKNVYSEAHRVACGWENWVFYCTGQPLRMDY